MNFGFVGSHRQWDRLSRWLAIGDSRLLSVLADPADRQLWPPHTVRCPDFDALLSDDRLGALILAGPLVRRPERLRRAAQIGLTCFCCHPADTSAITYHEAALAAQDAGASLIPLLPARSHPAWQQLLDRAASAPFGSLLQMTVERPATAETALELLFADYAEAAELVLALLGDVDELTAAGDPDRRRLTVYHRAGRGLSAEVRIAPEAQWRITLQGSGGLLQLRFPAGLAGAGSLTGPAPDDRQRQWEPEAVALEPVAQSLHEPDRPPLLPTWQQATEAAELAEAAAESLSRRRAVEVRRGGQTELALFKGTMTTCGCGLMLLALCSLFVVAAAQGLGLTGLNWLLPASLMLLLLFVGLQSLRWLVRNRD